MTQRRGKRTTRQNERECLNIVELPVPPNGFGARLESIHEFHRQRGLDDWRGRSQRRNDQDYVRWCFANRKEAEEFQNILAAKALAD